MAELLLPFVKWLAEKTAGEGLTDDEGEIDALAEAEGLVLALGLTEALVLEDGLKLAEGDIEADADEPPPESAISNGLAPLSRSVMSNAIILFHCTGAICPYNNTIVASSSIKRS